MYGIKLRSLRESRGESQAGLSRKLKTAQTNVSQWERVEYPPLEAIIKICKHYKVPLGVFFSSPGDEFIQLSDEEKQSVLNNRELPAELQEVLLDCQITLLGAYNLGRKAAK